MARVSRAGDLRLTGRWRENYLVSTLRLHAPAPDHLSPKLGFARVRAHSTAQSFCVAAKPWGKSQRPAEFSPLGEAR